MRFLASALRTRLTFFPFELMLNLWPFEPRSMERACCKRAICSSIWGISSFMSIEYLLAQDKPHPSLSESLLSNRTKLSATMSDISLLKCRDSSCIYCLRCKFITCPLPSLLSKQAFRHCIHWMREQMYDIHARSIREIA